MCRPHCFFKQPTPLGHALRVLALYHAHGIQLHHFLQANADYVRSYLGLEDMHKFSTLVRNTSSAIEGCHMYKEFMHLSDGLNLPLSDGFQESGGYLAAEGVLPTHDQGAVLS